MSKDNRNRELIFYKKLTTGEERGCKTGGDDTGTMVEGNDH